MLRGLKERLARVLGRPRRDDLLRPRMKPGGVICGDDWHDDPAHEHHGVAKAVREFCEREGWTLAERDAFGQWLIRP